MLVFNEGVPRAGKSFDAVRTHILPAVKARRQVYARLNGLNLAKIAEHLGMELEEVAQVLHLVESGQVREFFAAQQRENGEWCIPDHLKDALFVIDECHEFYVSTRDALPPAVEQFFALHGQNGMDGVLLSQWYKRLHVAIRARVERKNVFQKLTAAGMRGHYRVNFFQTIAPDKFETTGGETRKYDKAIFPLYAGYAPGAENDEVYSEGGRTIFAMFRNRALLVVPIGLVSAWYLFNFFTGGVSFSKSAKAEQDRPTLHQDVEKVATKATAAAAAAVVPPKPKLDALQQYILDMGAKGRVRLAARIETAAGELGLVEWVDGSGNVVERLTSRQINALGWDVVYRPFGVELNAKGERIVVTAWPLNVPIREAQPRLYNLSPQQAAQPSGVPSVSEPRPMASTHTPNVGTNYDFPGR